MPLADANHLIMRRGGRERNAVKDALGHGLAHERAEGIEEGVLDSGERLIVTARNARGESVEKAAGAGANVAERLNRERVKRMLLRERGTRYLASLAFSFWRAASPAC